MRKYSAKRVLLMKQKSKSGHHEKVLLLRARLPKREAARAPGH